MIKCLLSKPGLIAGPLHFTPLQINSQSIPRLDPIDSKYSLNYKATVRSLLFRSSQSLHQDSPNQKIPLDAMRTQACNAHTLPILHAVLDPTVGAP